MADPAWLVQGGADGEEGVSIYSVLGRVQGRIDDNTLFSIGEVRVVRVISNGYEQDKKVPIGIALVGYDNEGIFLKLEEIGILADVLSGEFGRIIAERAKL